MPLSFKGTLRRLFQSLNIIDPEPNKYGIDPHFDVLCARLQARILQALPDKIILDAANIDTNQKTFGHHNPFVTNAQTPIERYISIEKSAHEELYHEIADQAVRELFQKALELVAYVENWDTHKAQTRHYHPKTLGSEEHFKGYIAAISCQYTADLRDIPNVLNQQKQSDETVYCKPSPEMTVFQFEIEQIQVEKGIFIHNHYWR